MQHGPPTEAILADLLLPTQQWQTPVLIGIFGLPGTGKTAVAQYLAQQHPVVVLSTDAVRLRYNFPSGPATHEALAGVAGVLLAKQFSVVFDGVHLGQQDRARVRSLAQRYAAHARILYTTARLDVIAQRLDDRMRQPEQTCAAQKYVITPEHFSRIASYLEVPTPDEDVITIDTSDDTIGPQLASFEADLRRWCRTE